MDNDKAGRRRGGGRLTPLLSSGSVALRSPFLPAFSLSPPPSPLPVCACMYASNGEEGVVVVVVHEGLTRERHQTCISLKEKKAGGLLLFPWGMP